jgi:hypothetical protein
MSKPDEDPPVTGGRDLPESLVWRPSKLSEETLACYRAICTDRLLLTTFNEYVLQSRFESLFWHIDAQAEEIRRLREALEPFADAHRNHTRINWDDEECRRAAKAMEQQTTPRLTPPPA